jgi:hypothetical protein
MSLVSKVGSVDILFQLLEGWLSDVSYDTNKVDSASM